LDVPIFLTMSLPWKTFFNFELNFICVCPSLSFTLLSWRRHFRQMCFLMKLSFSDVCRCSDVHIKKRVLLLSIFAICWLFNCFHDHVIFIKIASWHFFLCVTHFVSFSDFPISDKQHMSCCLISIRISYFWYVEIVVAFNDDVIFIKNCILLKNARLDFQVFGFSDIFFVRFRTEFHIS
jgi:hypothetical protein